jgi:hypothetical protein
MELSGKTRGSLPKRLAGTVAKMAVMKMFDIAG